MNTRQPRIATTDLPGPSLPSPGATPTPAQRSRKPGTFFRIALLLGLLLGGAPDTQASSLEESFAEVPVRDRPWAYWWWLNGHVDRETIASDLEAMRRAGFGGLLMFDARGYHDDTRHVVLPDPAMEFMSAEWRELLAFGIREAGRLGLEVSVNLSSCAGALKGPWEVGADAPKRLIFEITPLKSGTRLDRTLQRPDLPHYWDVAVFAINYEGQPVEAGGEWRNAGDGVYTMKALSGGRVDSQETLEVHRAREVVEVTDTVDGSGRLVWDVPAGQWALVRFGYTTIDGHEYDVDVLDPVAVEGHFNRMGKTILADVGPLAGTTLTHFYSVSWEGAVPTWTGAFEREFEKYRGYTIRPWLPVLAGFTIRDTESSDAFVTDYRRARNDCFRDHFYGALMRLSHENGLKWHAESGGPWVRNPAVFGEADQLAFLGRTDMPQGEFWFTGKPDRIGRQLSRPPANAAHIYGRRLASAEAFTHMQRHWTPYPAVLKRSADESFLDGINHFVWHTFTCSPRKFGVPGSEYFAGTHINPNVTWFDKAGPFVAYLGRCQFLLRQGLYVADVCAYVGDVPYRHWGRFTSSWSEDATITLPDGYSYDVVNNEVLLERLTIRDGDLALPDGMTYRILVVDLDGQQASSAALAKIAELKQAGATVVFGDRKPESAPGPATDSHEIRQAGETLWADTTTLTEALAARKILPDFEGPFEFTHRQDGETEIYFVAGSGRGDCIFRVEGKQPELWCPVSGTVDAEPAWERLDDGRARLSLDLPQDGSVFVVFRKPGSPRQASAESPFIAGPELDGPWEVRFQEGRGAPERVNFESLMDWTEHPDEGIRFFSGTAVYRKTLDLSPDRATQSGRLQLGEVAALARVRLNGNDLGIVWTAPWQVDLTGWMKAGRNELEIEVTNTWANRLVGDAALPPDQRITRSNMAFEQGERTLRAFQGFASEDPLQPSGLRGPVRLEFR